MGSAATGFLVQQVMVYGARAGSWQIQLRPNQVPEPVPAPGSGRKVMVYGAMRL